MRKKAEERSGAGGATFSAALGPPHHFFFRLFLSPPPRMPPTPRVQHAADAAAIDMMRLPRRARASFHFGRAASIDDGMQPSALSA